MNYPVQKITFLILIILLTSTNTRNKVIRIRKIISVLELDREQA